MTVPSWQFILFALSGAAFFNLPFGLLWRRLVWLALNLGFVWSFAGAFWPLLPLCGFMALGYFGQEAARKFRSAAAPALAMLVLAVFIWLKRYSFIPYALLLSPGYMTVGLSYIFFRVMHLVIDAGQDEVRPISIPQYLNFVLNFPTFVSGPIQRLEDYEANSGLSLNLATLGWAFWRMVLGAFKVLIVSAALHGWQRELMAAMPRNPDAATFAWIVVLYPLFLYANFSGYTDFVIGVARLYRLRLPENFDRPFLATNFMEFWNRWHISLSQWLRSYVFSPLMMNWMRRYRSSRAKQYPAVAASFITFFLVGAWHGQTSEFLFFGVLQGGGVAGNRLYQVAMIRRMTSAGYARLAEHRLYRAVARGLTFTWFAFASLWFWGSWSQIGALAAQAGVAGCAEAALGTVAAASLVLAVPEMLGAAGRRIGVVLASRYARTVYASAMILAMAVATAVLHMPAPEIVYKQF